MDHNEQIVCGIFGERDIGAVSKSRLIVAVSKQSKLIRDLVEELFCENPYHLFFAQYTKEEVKPLIDERIRRRVGISGKSEVVHPVADGRNKNTKRL